MPTLKGFFRKADSGIKTVFKKGGIADTGLKKFGTAAIAAGGVAQQLAPLAAVVAPELAVPLMAGGALAKVAGSTALNARAGAIKGKTAQDKTQNVVNAVTSGIQAGKPAAAQLGPMFA